MLGCDRVGDKRADAVRARVDAALDSLRWYGMRQSRGPGAPAAPVRGPAVVVRYGSTVAWVYLGVAICSEVLGTSFLKQSDGFSRLWPSVVSVCGYGLALLTLSLAVRDIELGIAYAIWAGVGTALIVLIGWAVLGQRIDAAAIIGVLMIVGGVVVINVFSELEA